MGRGGGGGKDGKCSPKCHISRKVVTFIGVEEEMVDRFGEAVGRLPLPSRPYSKALLPFRRD